MENAKKVENSEAQKDSIINVKSVSQFEKVVLKSEKPAIIDFWAPWCAPCRMVAPVFQELSKEYNNEINFVKVNTQENPDIAQLFGIRSIPTMVIMKGEEVKDAMIGAAPRATIERMINRALGKANDNGFVDKLKNLFG